MGRSPMLCLLAFAVGASARPIERPLLAARHEAQKSLLSLRGGAHPVAVPTRPLVASVPPSGVVQAVSDWWASSSTVLLSIAAALALVSPALRALPFKAAFTAGVLVVALVQMALDGRAEQILLEAAVALIAAGVITLKDAFAGFSSEGVVAVGVMCAVAKGVQTTGGLELIAKMLLGSPSSYTVALLRMLAATMGISAFMNNTPVCAMMMPILTSWAANLGVGPAQLLMPLSFATMLGGTLTMIVSSTNLVAVSAADAWTLPEPAIRLPSPLPPDRCVAAGRLP